MAKKDNYKELNQFIKNYQEAMKEASTRTEQKKFKSFDQPITVKASSINEAQRTAEFIATKEVKDRDGDIVLVSGIDFENFLKNPVVPFAHDYSALPVGKVIAIRIEKEQMIVKIQFPQEGISDKADTVFNLVKGGFLSAVSIGFVPKEGAFDPKRDAFVISKSELLEVSIVPVPANQAAIIRSLSNGLQTVKTDTGTSTLTLEYQGNDTFTQVKEEEKEVVVSGLHDDEDHPGTHRPDEEEHDSLHLPEDCPDGEENCPNGDKSGHEEEEEDMKQCKECKLALCDSCKEVKEVEVDMDIVEHNKEMLKPYRKYMVLLREVLGIEGSEDEKETIKRVFEANLAMLKFIKDSCSTENLESNGVTSENQKATPKQPSVEDLALKVLKNL